MTLGLFRASLNRLLDVDPDSFEGGINTHKYNLIRRLMTERALALFLDQQRMEHFRGQTV